MVGATVGNVRGRLRGPLDALALPHGSGILSERVANVWLCCGVCTHARSRVGKMAVLGGGLAVPCTCNPLQQG
jgi:hypothetical protein